MMQGKLDLRTRQVGPWAMNTYALVCPQTGESALIDPGADPEILLEMLAGSTPRAIWLTHTHHDHIGALAEMRARLGVPLLAHPGPHADGMELEADRWLKDGEVVSVGAFAVRVYHAPGHIDDQICFALENDYRVVVGDTIFEGGPGKTWSPEGFETTLETLRKVILPWPDETVCYPGHGSAFQLGDQRAAIEAFLGKGHGRFFGDATWEM